MASRLDALSRRLRGCGDVPRTARGGLLQQPTELVNRQPGIVRTDSLANRNLLRLGGRALHGDFVDTCLAQIADLY